MQNVNAAPKEVKELLIERLLAKAELTYKCCAGNCGHIATDDAQD
ncbi:MAG: hypothetical protein P4M08_01055 [Oligoflexia bacterium]|nr:hypothetical protein [Oligoflexia bacterium]